MLLEVFNAGTSDALIFFITKINREICNMTGNLPYKYRENNHSGNRSRRGILITVTTGNMIPPVSGKGYWLEDPVLECTYSDITLI